MKKLLFTAALLFAAITSNAQSVTIGGYTVSYNEAAAKNIGFSVDVADNSGYLATCKNAVAAIHYLKTELKIKLTDGQMLVIYNIAKEQPPQWLLNAAGVKRI